MLGAILFIAGAAASPSTKTDDQWRGESIELRVMTNVITSLHVDSSKIVEDEVVCGSANSFVFKQTRDSTQLNVEPKPGMKIGFRTNCNVALENGVSIPVWLVVVDKLPDTMRELHLGIKAEAHVHRASSADTDEKVFAAIEDYKEKSRLSLATQASEATVSKTLSDRTMQEGIVLALHNHVRLGSLAIVRFSVENRSRSAWPAGEVKIQWYVPGRDPKPLDATFFFRSPVIESGEEVFGALVSTFYDMPENAHFSIQVFEKNGARHPRIDGVKL